MGQQGEAGNCCTISILAKFTLFAKTTCTQTHWRTESNTQLMSCVTTKKDRYDIIIGENNILHSIPEKFLQEETSQSCRFKHTRLVLLNLKTKSHAFSDQKVVMLQKSSTQAIQLRFLRNKDEYSIIYSGCLVAQTRPHLFLPLTALMMNLPTQ